MIKSSNPDIRLSELESWKQGELHPVGSHPVHEGRKWGSRPRWLEKDDAHEAFTRYVCVHVYWYVMFFKSLNQSSNIVFSEDLKLLVKYWLKASSFVAWLCSICSHTHRRNRKNILFTTWKLVTRALSISSGNRNVMLGISQWQS